MVAEKIYKVFVSSTYEDLREERGVVQKALLQVNCLPVGMELFPAADEETWTFIKSQIDDSDYYVVMVAGRYGSLAQDGLSFTEKEYDYALLRKKPTIGFVHGRPGSIASEKTELTQNGRDHLQAFLQKLKQRPVRQFTSPHELALEVTTSFIALIKSRPAVGYVRSDEAVEFKQYAHLLEENNSLKEQLKLAERSINNSIFPAHKKQMKLTLNAVRQTPPEEKLEQPQQERLSCECSLADAFQVVAEGSLQSLYEYEVLSVAAFMLSRKGETGESWEVTFDDESIQSLRRQLLLYGLIEIVPTIRNTHSMFPMGSARSETVNVWKLTDYGRRQLIILTSG
jgi:hypothetical protein